MIDFYLEGVMYALLFNNLIYAIVIKAGLEDFKWRIFYRFSAISILSWFMFVLISIIGIYEYFTKKEI